MTTEETYRKLLEDMRRDLDENQRDLRRAADHYDKLIVERRKLWAGYYGIKAELNDIKGAD
ncbi:hypothetical protein V7114_06845 [Neobacillus niacini]|uniref:hypothetical protein n=1 Tax=Neobacillus niacini TaxID=86668 RepID=UPI002FFD90C1